MEHKQEVERIVYEDLDPDNGFVMVPDLKWNGEIDTLYILAIVNKRDIKSIRDLTKEHLPLLKNIRKKGCVSIFLFLSIFIYISIYLYVTSKA